MKPLVALASLLMVLAGCRKDAQSAPPDDYGQAYLPYEGEEGDYTVEGANFSGGGGGYGGDEMEMVVDSPAAPPAQRWRGREGKQRKNEEGAKRDFADTTSPEAPAPAIVDSTTGVGALEPEPAKDEDHDDRQIIYTAMLQLAVYELDAVMAIAEDLPNRYGGWVEARHDYQITLRVPADELGPIITELSALGLVLGKTLQADDVTDQYTDLESRIRVLEQLLEQLELLLTQAKTVEESLKVRRELERVRIELEAAKAAMRQLAESISFSTLSLHLVPRGSATLPTSNDPFPWVDELGVETTEYR